MRSIASMAVLSAALVAAQPLAATAAACSSIPAPQPDSTRPVLTGRMVYQSGNALYLTNFNGQTTTAISFTTTAAPNSPMVFQSPENANFSPDGRWIIFSAIWTPSNGVVRRDVFIATPSGAHLVNLTADQNASLPNADPRFAFDGKTVVYKQFYYPGGATAAQIMTMQVGLPTGDTTDPLRLGAPTVLLTDNHSEFSQPSLSPSGKYLYYTVGSGATEEAYQYNTATKTSVVISAKPGVYSYYPVSRDLTTTFFSGWASATNMNDQIYVYAPSLSPIVLHLSLNDPNANDSDPATVNEDYLIFSSTRCGGGYKLYVGSMSASKYWPLDIDNINAPTSDILGAAYTGKAATD